MPTPKKAVRKPNRRLKALYFTCIGLGTVLVLISAWYIFDGIVSLIMYWHQHWYEQAFRVVRTLLAFVVIYIGIKLPLVIRGILRRS
jgi:hypothetical protein